jgi:hypothetical protein
MHMMDSADYFKRAVSSGLYYKRITIVIDAPSVISKWRSKLQRHLLTIVIDDTS